MAESVQITTSLEGIYITSGPKKDEFIVSEIFSESTAEAFGISVGDTIQNVNDEPFAEIVHQCPFTDPNCLLWDIETPYQLSFTKNHAKMGEDSKYSEEIREPEKVREFVSDYDPNLISMAIDNTKRMNAMYTALFPTKSFPPFPLKPLRKLKFADQLPSGSGPSGFNRSASVDETDLEITQSTPQSETTATLTSISMSVREISWESSSETEEEFEPSPSPTPFCADIGDMLLRRHILQKYSLNPFVHFNRASITESNGKIIAVSSKPLVTGEHNWTLEITQCDVDIQEIGVCTVCDIEGIQIADGGVTETTALGARGLYGNELATASRWYASMNDNGARRCFKDLSGSYRIGWTAKDQIKVVVDLNKFRMKFYLNGRKVYIDLFCPY